MTDRAPTHDGVTRSSTGGDVRWYLHGQLHRDGAPAVETAVGLRQWYQHGQLHRTDGPAAETASGLRLWYQHGELHRIDGPADEASTGLDTWVLHGRVLELDDVDLFARLADDDRDLVAELYAAGTSMVDAISTAVRLRHIPDRTAT